MKKAFFITGTDTDVGKTYIACKLIRQYVAQGYKVVGMKPVAAGCDLIDGEWVNDDVLKLELASNVKAPRQLTNPYCFKEPIAPHIAAKMAGIHVELAVIQQAYNQLTQMADIVIVEGAGGLLVPLNAHQTIADLIAHLNIPIVLIVGVKLGCINHAYLTANAIQQRQLSLHSWVANSINTNMLAHSENIAQLQTIFSQSVFSGIKQLNLA